MDCWLERSKKAIEHATDGMSEEQLAWHPDGKWSSAQILEHLSLAFAGTAKGMERVLANGTAPALRRTIGNRVTAFIVVRLGYMPEGRQAPKGTIPGNGDPATAIAATLAHLATMRATFCELEKDQGRRIRLEHPILGPLALAEWRKFHWVHTAHHMKQIERLKELQR